MWHTPTGDRAPTPGEEYLIRVGLDLAWDAVEIAAETGNPEATGVGVFDALQPGQQIALLALVGTALADPMAPAPPLTAATEAALAAMFAQVRAWLEVELFDGDRTECRRLLLGAAGSGTERDVPLPDANDADRDEWELLLEEVESCLFWDNDWEIGDVFLDRPPDRARADMVLHGIDPDYFLAVPVDPNDRQLAEVRRTLAKLTGRDVKRGP